MYTNKAVFLDKDGTLVVDIPYNTDPDKIYLSGEMTWGLKQLREAGYKLILVSNQSGIAFGYFDFAALKRAQQRLVQLLAAKGIVLDGFYYCPHHPDGLITAYSISCDCRKPGAGMLIRAAGEHHLDLSSSWMIGDILNDIEAGNTAGCRTVLINNGNETEWKKGPGRTPQFITHNINEAATRILL